MIKQMFRIFNLFDLFRLIVGSVLIFAAIPKILDPLDFAFNLSAYQLFPKGLITVMAVLVPYIEMITGVLILTGIKIEGALVIAIGMFTVFVFSLLWAISLGLDINCGCYGQDLGEKSNLWIRVGEDVIYIIACILVLKNKLTASLDK